MATLAIPAPGEPSLRDRIEDLSARAERASDTVATSETPSIVPWPVLRKPAELPARATVAEEPAEQARKLEMLGRMAAGVAHDLNNLLAVIGGHAELLTIDSPDRGPAHSDVIQTSIRLASQLTGRLLAFAKPAVSFVSPVLGTVVTETMPLLRAIAGSGVECIVINEGEPLRVPVRRDRIEQVVLNLVTNARDALTEAGVIVVQASATFVGSDRKGWPADRPAGQYAVLTVADNGRGMDEATQARIFDRYFTTRGTDGTGLGLATVREIVDLANGHVEVESAPGRGAIFRVFFPVEELGTGFDQSVRDLAASANGRTVLLVDDDASVRRLAKAWLESAGYDVIEARDGDEAARLERVVREPIDLLVADFVMPGLGGRKLAERMRCSRPGLPVVFISGYANPFDRPEPGIRFVPKPFARSALLEAVEMVSRTVATS
jgi:two-component system, cell cycle sensor histidine kinase and response regulator CckA